MTTITLPPDLETRLAAEAARRGATVEEVAVEKLRTMYPSPPPELEELPEGTTMYDYLKDHIGVLEGPTDLSKDTGKQFGELLEADYLRQQEEFRRRKQSQ